MKGVMEGSQIHISQKRREVGNPLRFIGYFQTHLGTVESRDSSCVLLLASP